MKNAKVTFRYPEVTKSGLSEKVIEMTQVELTALLICDVINSEGKCYEPEYKMYKDNETGGEIVIQLAEARRFQD